MSEPEAFHRRGHHVQKAHGRRYALAADDRSHTQGGMIALMPSPADAKRLALPGGEPAAELHCTLLYLGDDVSGWTPEDRDALELAFRSMASDLTPVSARIFGVAHWNGDGPKPSWVWSVGDPPDADPEATTLETARWTVGDALGMAMSARDGELPEAPAQHSPWVAHICAAYTDDLTLVRGLEKRLGPVTFDRVRLSFGDDDRDIPLTGGALTASALRREIHEHEEHCDFAEHNRQWEGAVATASTGLSGVLAEWRAALREQIASGLDTPEELAQLSLDPGPAVGVLDDAMQALAVRAGQALQREAEKQGVEVPEWTVPDDTLTAAIGGRRLLRSVAEASAGLLSSSLVQAARRAALQLLTRQGDPQQLAAEVDRTLADGQDAALRGPVGTAMSTAQTAGRQAVLEAAPPATYYASEILDKNTCGPCKAVDGEVFNSLAIAIKAYPVMGYKDCVGSRYGNPCRGLIVARWQPEDSLDTGPVTAAVEMHGTPGQPGYELLHGGDKVQPKEVLSENEEGVLREDLNQAYYAGFNSREYNAFTDPGSHDYDPEDELSDGEVNFVEWEGLSRYYAASEDHWFGDFATSQETRRAANALAGIDAGEQDRLIGEGEPSDFARVAALGMMMGVATAPPRDTVLHRGSLYEGADPDEIEAAFRSQGHMNFGLVSFTNSPGVADYFASPGLFESNQGRPPGPGTTVRFEVEPGAQSVIGRVFSNDMSASGPGTELADMDEDEYDSMKTNTDPDHAREYVTGGRFDVTEVSREGDTVTVRLKQTHTFNPATQEATLA